MNKKASIGPVLLTIFLDMLGFGTIIPIIRDITIELTRNSSFWIKNPEMASVILMASYAFFQFLTLPLMGRISDKYGRKTVLSISVFGNVISYIIWMVSSNYWVFLFSRIISGASGANIGVAQGYIADITTPENRAKSMGLMGAALGLGFILGPYIGGLLSEVPVIEVAGWQWLSNNSFWAIGAFAAFLSAANLMWIKIGLVETVNLKEKEAKPEKKYGLLQIQVVFDILRKHPARKLFFVYFMTHIGFVMMEATLAWYLLLKFNLNARHTGNFFAYIGLIMVIFQGGIYRIAVKKAGETVTALIGGLLLIIAWISFSFVNELNTFLFFAGVMAAGNGLMNPSIFGILSIKTEAKEQGVTLGLQQSFGSLARIMGPIIGMWLYREIYYGAPYLLGATFVLLASILLMSVGIIHSAKEVENEKKAKPAEK